MGEHAGTRVQLSIVPLGGSGKPAQLFRAGPPILVTNLSATVTAYIGEYDDCQVGAMVASATPLFPGDSIVYNGQVPKYANVPIGQAGSINIETHGVAYISAQAIASQILAQGLATDIVNGIGGLGLATLIQQIANETGIPNNIAVAGAPLLIKNGLLVTSSSAVSSGGSNTLGPYGITQPGWEIELLLSGVFAAETEVGMQLTWTDSNSGDTVANDQYYMLAPGLLDTQFYYFRGPTKANELTVTISGYNNGCDYTITVLQNSRVYSRNQAVQASYSPSSGGYTNANANPQGAALMWTGAINIAAGGTAVRPIPLYDGLVSIQFQSSSGTSDAELSITAQADQTSAVKPNVFDMQTNAGGNSAQPNIALPRSSCLATLTNHNAAAKNLSMCIVAAPLEA